MAVHVEEVINALRKTFPSLMAEVERMLDEFTRRSFKAVGLLPFAPASSLVVPS